MEDIRIRGRAVAQGFLALVNVAAVGLFAWRAGQGHPLPIALVVILAGFACLNFFFFLRPPILEVTGDRLRVRVGFLSYASPLANVAAIEPAGKGLRIVFSDLSLVEASPHLRPYFENNFTRGKFHAEVAVRPKAADFERLRGRLRT